MELRRQDEVYLNGRATSGFPTRRPLKNFTRLFEEDDIVAQEKCVNRVRLAVWRVTRPIQNLLSQLCGLTKMGFIPKSFHIAMAILPLLPHQACLHVARKFFNKPEFSGLADRFPHTTLIRHSTLQ